MKTLWILLVDSVRMLRAQKLFWVVLGLSGLVALLYASIGIDENGFSAFFGLWTIAGDFAAGSKEQAKGVYLLIFTNLIVRVWLSFIAIILALISCASIFPEFVKKGSVDLVLSKPPSRLVLFLGKYLGSLLFVIAQVLLFCIIVFLALGFRYGEWNLTVFWAVPVVTFIFSLIYSVHVLISIWSGSVVFGLLAACLVWGLGILAEWGEALTYQFVYLHPQLGMQVFTADGMPEMIEPKDSLGPGAETVYAIVNGLRTPLPKTRVASNQLNRLIVVGKGDKARSDLATVGASVDAGENEAGVLERYERRHPIWLDMLSSAGFELVVLGLAATVFCRRDY